MGELSCNGSIYSVPQIVVVVCLYQFFGLPFFSSFFSFQEPTAIQEEEEEKKEMGVPEVGVQGCMQKFDKGRANFGYLKKRGGAAASSVRGSTERQCGPTQHIKQNLKHLAK